MSEDSATAWLHCPISEEDPGTKLAAINGKKNSQGSICYLVDGITIMELTA